MTIRHIILEGMDGTGKTTLLDTLLARLPQMKPHNRSSWVSAGPKPDLDQWTLEDTKTIGTHPMSIYDRHPLVSEPIYGPIIRGGVPGLFNQDWWVNAMTAEVAHHALLIYCNPPLTVVQQNLRQSEDNQMKGVVEKAPDLYYRYAVVSNRWPGVQLRYDYTRNKLATLLNMIRLVIPQEVQE